MARMTPDCRRVEATLMRMQREFLDHRGLKLTLAEAQHRFGLDAETCRTLLGVLTDAHVLTMTADDAYARYFPQPGQRAANGETAPQPPKANRARKVIPLRPVAA